MVAELDVLEDGIGSLLEKDPKGGRAMEAAK